MHRLLYACIMYTIFDAKSRHVKLYAFLIELSLIFNAYKITCILNAILLHLKCMFYGVILYLAQSHIYAII